MTAILAPLGRDGELLHAAAGRAKANAIMLRDAHELDAKLADGAVGTLVLTQEALVQAVLDVLARHGEHAAPWDQLPVLLLVDPRGNTAANLAALRKALPDLQISILQRPVRLTEFSSALEMLARVRGRQYELRDMLARENALRRELNHRVKNILGTVQALYELSSRRAKGPEALAVSFQGRLSAMARVHELLFASGFGLVDAGALIRTVLSPYGEGAGSLSIAGETMEVSAEAAHDIALCVHELATNSVKYGALGAETGRVDVRWDEQEPSFALTWRESGGPTVVEPDHVGFGQTFIAAAMRRFGGSSVMDYNSKGLTAQLTASLHDLR